MSDYVNYQGRMVLKKGFRVFIYGYDDKSKLVNSWEEFQKHMESGEWFDSIQKAISKSKKRVKKNGSDG